MMLQIQIAWLCIPRVLRPGVLHWIMDSYRMLTPSHKCASLASSPTPATNQREANLGLCKVNFADQAEHAPVSLSPLQGQQWFCRFEATTARNVQRCTAQP
jgi:hypothetical protein